MASTGKKKKNNRPSDEKQVMCLGFGILLVAFGILLTLSSLLNLQGSVFQGARSLAAGLGGGLAALVGIIPIWSGITLIISAYYPVRLKTMLLAFTLLVLLLTMVTACSRAGSLSYMDYLYAYNKSGGYYPADSYSTYLARSYEWGSTYGYCGGALGMLLCWPLWKLGGAVLAAILTALLMLADLFFLLNLSPEKLRAIRAKLAGQNAEKVRDGNRRLLWWKKKEAGEQEEPQGGYDPYEQPRMAGQTQRPVQQPVGPVGMPQRAQRQPVAQTGSSRPVRDGNYVQVTPGKTATAPIQPAQSYKKQRRDAIFDQEQPQQPGYTMQDMPVRQPKQERPVQEPAYQETVYRQPVQQPLYEEPVQPVQQPVYEEPVRSVQQPVYEEPVQPVQQPVYEEPVQPVQQPVYEEPAQPVQQPVYEEPVQPVQQPAYEEPAQPKPTARSPWQQQLDALKKGQSETAAVVSSWGKPSAQDTPPWEEAPEDKEEEKPGMWKPELKLPDPAPKEEEPEEPWHEIPYVYPNYSLLRVPERPNANAAAEDDELSARLEETLKSFKVPAKVRHVTHGPAISRFELEIAPGIRVNKITELDRNIAMNMEVKSVRIEAPIPGKSLVGVEIPNRKVTPVTLREVLETNVMSSMKSSLGVALGKDIAGTPIVCDLARMPHLLIAGATGSGKSVCINTIISSLLFRSSPKEVRLILVDPKVVELQPYNDIPHLLLPVVTDPHKAAAALQWAVAEMMDRYHRFTQQAVRDIKGYNEKVGDGPDYMSRIVIIIDELADLMMTCKKDVEDSICRIAQLARAAGIHLIVATQRPSVDVITGLIKANIPSRIAFKVSSFVDSRTIIDRPGADKLLGYGDMLYLPNGAFTPTRIQGCFLDDGEIERITGFIKETSAPSYDSGVIQQLENANQEPELPEGADAVTPEADADADLLAQAVEMAVTDGQVSTSLLQRRLRVGYARAGRLVDEMEKRGIVSQKDNAKPRLCLITREQYEQMKAAGALKE